MEIPEQEDITIVLCSCGHRIGLPGNQSQSLSMCLYFDGDSTINICEQCLEKQCQHQDRLIQQLRKIKKFYEQIKKLQKKSSYINIAVQQYISDGIQKNKQDQNNHLQELTEENLQQQLTLLTSQYERLCIKEKQQYIKEFVQSKTQISQRTKEIHESNIQVQHNIKYKSKLTILNNELKEQQMQLEIENVLTYLYNITFDNNFALINDEIITYTNVWKLAALLELLISIDKGYKRTIKLNLSKMMLYVSQNGKNFIIQNNKKLDKSIYINNLQIKANLSEKNKYLENYKQRNTSLNNQDQNWMQIAIKCSSPSSTYSWLEYLFIETQQYSEHFIKKYFQGKGYKLPYSIKKNVINGSQFTSIDYQLAIKYFTFDLKYLINLNYYASEKLKFPEIQIQNV